MSSHITNMIISGTASRKIACYPVFWVFINGFFYFGFCINFFEPVGFVGEVRFVFVVSCDVSFEVVPTFHEMAAERAFKS